MSVIDKIRKIDNTRSEIFPPTLNERREPINMNMRD